MSFIDRVIHVLDPHSNAPYVESEIDSIKKHIGVLINSKDVIGLLSLDNLNIGAKDFGVIMSEKICNIIAAHEHRIQILNIGYDSTLSPWQTNFFVRFRCTNDRFKEYNIQLIFKNNRYCEIV